MDSKTDQEGNTDFIFHCNNNQSSSLWLCIYLSYWGVNETEKKPTWYPSNDAPVWRFVHRNPMKQLDEVKNHLSETGNTFTAYFCIKTTLSGYILEQSTFMTHIHHGVCVNLDSVPSH